MTIQPAFGKSGRVAPPKHRVYERTLQGKRSLRNPRLCEERETLHPKWKSAFQGAGAQDLSKFLLIFHLPANSSSRKFKQVHLHMKFNLLLYEIPVYLKYSTNPSGFGITYLNANRNYKTTPKEKCPWTWRCLQTLRMIILDFLSARISCFCLSSPVQCIF